MGLMYPFPISTDESDFAEKKDNRLVLKTYGLPYLFWIYAICSVTVIFFMFLAIKAPILKLIELGDQTDATLGYSLLTFIGLMPLAIFAFFFYEKRIIASAGTLCLQHRIFGITFFSSTYQLDPSDHFTVGPFLSSPNVARMKSKSEEQGFQNKGYFVLWLEQDKLKRVFIDRHSRKADLVKLKELLESVMNPRA